MKKYTFLPFFFFLTSTLFAQKLYDKKNDVFIDLGKMSEIQYLSIKYGYRKIKNEKYMYCVNIGQKENWFLADFDNTNIIGLCNYLHSLGWDLVTISPEVSNIVTMIETEKEYIFKRKGTR